MRHQQEILYRSEAYNTTHFLSEAGCCGAGVPARLNRRRIQSWGVRRFAGGGWRARRYSPVSGTEPVFRLPTAEIVAADRAEERRHPRSPNIRHPVSEQIIAPVCHRFSAWPLPNKYPGRRRHDHRLPVACRKAFFVQHRI